MKSPPDEPCIIIINNEQYDVSTFKSSHPGGPEILEKYNGKDATDVFHAFHRPKAMGGVAWRRLPALPRLGEAATATTPALDDWRQLRQKLTDQGLLEPAYGWFLWKFASTLAIGAFAFWLAYWGHWAISSLILGIFFQQMAFIGHDLGHNSVFVSRDANRRVGLFVSHFCQGISLSWWNVRHNVHHAITNVLDVDQDIDHMPLFSYDERDLDRVEPGSLAASAIPYQNYLFWFVIPILRLLWALQSLEQCMTLKVSPVAFRRERFPYELGALIGWWIWYWTYLFVATPTWSAFFIALFISQTVSGAGITLVVFLTHNSSTIFGSNERLKRDFLELQFYTTRNFTPSILTDWAAGGLNYQLEHHLFPQAPRNRMYEVSLHVREFCRKHNFPYECDDWTTCLGHFQKRLSDIAKVAKKKFHHPDFQTRKSG